jgi:hypothetical protein
MFFGFADQAATLNTQLRLPELSKMRKQSTCSVHLRTFLNSYIPICRGSKTMGTSGHQRKPPQEYEYWLPWVKALKVEAQK